jgi:hypothetical protein
MNDDHLLESSNKQLDRVLGFFPRVDAKASVVLAVDTGMVAFLAAKMPPLRILIWPDIAIAAAAFLLLGASFWHLYKGAFPKLEGGAESLVYFREIAKRREAPFIEAFSKQTPADHARDLLGQTWRNAQILTTKYDQVRLAFIFLALAVPAWVASLILLSARAVSAGVRPSP